MGYVILFIICLSGLGFFFTAVIQCLNELMNVFIVIFRNKSERLDQQYQYDRDAQMFQLQQQQLEELRKMQEKENE